MKKPTRIIQASPKGTDVRSAYLETTDIHPTKPGKIYDSKSKSAQNEYQERGNRVYSLRQRSRCQPYDKRGKIIQKANAVGKADGYADLDTIT